MKSDLKNLGNAFSLEKLEFVSAIWDEGIKIGLDIGTFSVKVVQMKDTVKGPLLQKVGYAQIPEPPDAATEGAREQLIAQTLEELWKRQGIKTRHVNLVISDPSVYLRHVRVPAVSQEELLKAIRWLAEKYTPFPIDDAIVDFQILPDKARTTDNQMDIILVAAQRKMIDKYLTILKKARLTPLGIGVTPFAVARALTVCHPVPKDQMVAVVDLGAQSTSVVMVRGDNLQLVRNFALGGEILTAAIAQGLSIDPAEAEKVKKDFTLPGPGQPGAGNPDRVWTALQPVLADLVKEINRSFAYCERELVEEKIQKVFICGGTAAMPGLDQYLAQGLGVSVERADAFRRFPLVMDQKKNPVLAVSALPMMAAVGEVAD